MNILSKEGMVQDLSCFEGDFIILCDSRDLVVIRKIFRRDTIVAPGERARVHQIFDRITDALIAKGII